MKIRYIEQCDKKSGEVTNYFIEEKTWFGWKRLGYTIDFGHGGVYNYFKNKDKKALLDEVLLHKKLCLDFINIVEYPSIKEY